MREACRAMALNGPFARARARRRGARSGDAKDPKRELRRAIDRAAAREGEPEAVQIAGQPIMPDVYARWRARKLGEGAIFVAPDLVPGQYAFVLLAIDLESSSEFTHHGDGGLLTQPTVEAFEIEVPPTQALTRMLANWLDRYPRPVALAPPLLHFDGRWRATDLGLDWALPSNES